jgi:hypothetical protein
MSINRFANNAAKLCSNLGQAMIIDIMVYAFHNRPELGLILCVSSEVTGCMRTRAQQPNT